MSKILKDVKLPINDDLNEHLKWLMPNHGEYRILRQSVDARKKHSPHFVYTLEVAEGEEKLQVEEFSLSQKTKLPANFKKPIIVGSGPAGLFAALRANFSNVEATLPNALRASINFGAMAN